jgi:branched-chain amino acid transport system substrate-binding protein
VLIVKTLQTLQVNPKLIGCSTSVGVPDVLNALGSASQDLMGILYWDPAFSYQGKVIVSSASFRDGYVKQFNSEPNYLSAAAAGAGIVMQQAITDAGALDPVKIRDAISRLDISTFFNRVKFNDRGANVLATSAVAQVRDGKPLLVWPKDLQVAPVQYPRRPFA